MQVILLVKLSFSMQVFLLVLLYVKKEEFWAHKPYFMDHIFWLVSIFIFVSVNELVLGAKLFYNHLLSIRSFVWASVKESFVIYVYYLYSSKPSANKETVGYVLLLQIGIFCVGDKRTAPPPPQKKQK